MHSGMNIQEMLTEVVRQAEVKKDYVADTAETIRMVRMPDFRDGVALVLLSRPTIALAQDMVNPPTLERFEITNNCHDQLASRLGIPLKYYRRLLADHTDLVLENVNTLFEREPSIRMIRTLDGKARAFLSNSYRRVDNDEIIEATLPVIRNEYDTTMLNSYVDENRMRIKCLFNGDEHSVVVGKTRDGADDVVNAGFEMGNSEVGGGSFYIRGFLYRGYCLNGCVWGTQDTVSMRRIHVGSKIDVPTDFILSDDTKRKEDELIVAAAKDTLAALSRPEFTQEVGKKIRHMNATDTARDPEIAVETVCKELSIPDRDRKTVLESFIREGNYNQWGMLNAVTSVQHTKDDYEAAHEFEELGSKIATMSLRRWNSIAHAEAA